MPTPSSTFGAGPPPDPSVWSQQQQQQFMDAMMGAGAARAASNASSVAADPMAALMASMMGGGAGPSSAAPGAPDMSALMASFGQPPSSDRPQQDPLAALMASMGGGGGDGQSPFGPAQSAPAIQPPSRLRKLMPFVHLLAVWSLLAYFVGWLEPKIYASTWFASEHEDGWLKRWGVLSTERVSDPGMWGVRMVVRSPFVTFIRPRRSVCPC